MNLSASSFVSSLGGLVSDSHVSVKQDRGVLQWEGRAGVKILPLPVCPWCASPTVTIDHEHSPGEEWDRDRDLVYKQHCLLCGWWHDANSTIGSHVIPFLSSVPLSDPRLPLHELGSHLRTHFADVYALGWRRFEELVADIFRSVGFHAVLTSPTKDNGADIILLTDDRVCTLIECKKWAATRTLGVDVVRALVGACVDWDTRRARVVTTVQRSSSEAEQYAKRQQRFGYDIQLMVASDLLKMLQCYTCGSPALAELTPAMKADIIEANGKRLACEVDAGPFKLWDIYPVAEFSASVCGGVRKAISHNRREIAKLASVLAKRRTLDF